MPQVPPVAKACLPVMVTRTRTTMTERLEVFKSKGSVTSVIDTNEGGLGHISCLLVIILSPMAIVEAANYSQVNC